MLTSSAQYGAALLQPHRRVSRVSVRTPDGELLAEPTDITTGQVQAHLTSRVSRTANFSAPLWWLPVAGDDPLSPSHAIAHIEAGISYVDGAEEMFPIFTGRIYAASMDSAGLVGFRADDLAADVLAADFEQPVNSQLGASTVAEAQRLILEGYPWATFGTNDVTDAFVPKLTWDDDRGKALDDLAAVVEGRWFPLGNGDFVIRRYAYEDTTPQLTLTDGPQGTLSGATVALTADGTYNSVVVLAERLDGGAPIRVVERNLNATSPFRYDGPFGRRVKKVRMQTAAGLADAQRVARAQLAAASALTRQWSMSCTADYRIEPGDVAATSWRGVSDVQILDSVTYPLGTGDAMTLQGRSSLEVVS